MEQLRAEEVSFSIAGDLSLLLVRPASGWVVGFPCSIHEYTNEAFRLEPSSVFLSFGDGSFLLRQRISDLEELPVAGAMALGMLLEERCADATYGSDCSASRGSVIRAVGFSLSRYHHSTVLAHEMSIGAPRNGNLMRRERGPRTSLSSRRRAQLSAEVLRLFRFSKNRLQTSSALVPS
jgi:hypothetical protein